MKPLAINTKLTMREHLRWLATTPAPVVTATVVSKRTNPRGVITYGLEFVSNKKLNDRPVKVYRLLTSKQLEQCEAQVIRKARKPAAPKVVKRSGVNQLPKAG